MSITPLGSPVVPLDYGIVATSTAGAISTDGPAACAPRTSASEIAPSPASPMTTSRVPLGAAVRAFSRSSGDRDQDPCAGVDELGLDLAAGIAWIERRARRSRQGRAEEHEATGSRRRRPCRARGPTDPRRSPASARAAHRRSAAGPSRRRPARSGRGGHAAAARTNPARSWSGIEGSGNRLRKIIAASFDGRGRRGHSVARRVPCPVLAPFAVTGVTRATARSPGCEARRWRHRRIPTEHWMSNLARVQSPRGRHMAAGRQSATAYRLFARLRSAPVAEGHDPASTRLGRRGRQFSPVP